jgi:hypothetical protein
MERGRAGRRPGVAMTALEALDRTALLINDDFFAGRLAQSEIVDGLLGTTIRIVARRDDLASPAGQTALTTLVCLVGMLGVSIELAVPRVGILTPQPPIQGDELREGLLRHGRSVIPGARISDAPSGDRADVTIALGSAAAGCAEGTIAVTGDASSCRVGQQRAVLPALWQSSWPFGAMAGATAAAGEVFRVALAGISARAGLPYPVMCRPPGLDVVELTLGSPSRAPVNLGAVQVVSAGAIVNAMLFALLRVPGVRAELTIFDDDSGALSNLNRCPLMELGDMDIEKVTLLERFATRDVRIRGVVERFGDGTNDRAARMVVGADDIPVRWAAQRHSPTWLGVGATSHLFTMVSNHGAVGPCAGCVHDHADPDPDPIIPTISVVSFMAGLLLAADLVGVGTGTTGYVTRSFPLGLGGPHSFDRLPLKPNPRCPVGCPASTATRRDHAPVPLADR